MLERQELHCHNCNRYVQFDIDTELDGNHVLTCPNCGHEHCRVVKAGIITEDRWDSRNPTYPVNGTTASVTLTSTFTNYTNAVSATTNTVTGATVFTYSAWMNTTSY